MQNKRQRSVGNPARPGSRSRRVLQRPRRTRFVDIFRTTPPVTVCPNFYVLAHANGCRFSPACSYCYLKSSLWHLPAPVAYRNVARLLREVRAWIARDDLESYVLNSGNLCDSLAFEPTRPLMARLVEVFRKHAAGRPHTLLLVTKGGLRECAGLFATEPCPNVVVSFSVSDPETSRHDERGAAPVAERLQAAARLKRCGWRVRIRVDPMILGRDCSVTLRAVRRLRPERVTLGTLRAEPGLRRFVDHALFRHLVPPAVRGGLARYPLAERLALYRRAIAILDGTCPIGLCEEEPAVWDALGLDKAAKPCNCCV